MSNEPDNVAIIVLNWNDSNGTIKTIEALTSVILPGDHIIIIDNASTPELNIKSSPELTLIRSVHNLGFAGGNNLGIELAVERQFPYIMLLNADAHLTIDTLSSLRNYLNKHPDMALVGPVLHEGQNKSYGGMDIGKHLNTRITDLRFAHLLQYIPGTAILVRAKVFEKIGVLDEDYFFSGEIADFCMRAGKAGLKIGIDKQSVTEHRIDQRPGNLRNTLYTYYNFRNRFLFIRKHHHTVRMRYFLKWLYLGIVQYLGSIKNGDSEKARAIRLAIRDGIFGKFGNQNDKFI
ncbi:MAG: glycosyltransferase family 2 protein [Saprospiraceae bacterium]|nr:glycosyltransferase family 2 protein [Saprospiraceae bacterium]